MVIYDILILVQVDIGINNNVIYTKTYIFLYIIIMNFNRNVNLIHNCISFFPSLLYKQTIKYSKEYQAKGNINLSDFIISPPFKETIIPTHSMDLYYNYYIYKYPLLSPNTVKNLLIDYFKSYSLHSVITISSSGTFSKEILSQIDNNIHLYVNTNHFLKDNFTIKNNTNVIALTLNLSRYSSESIKYICDNIINKHIKSLTLISEFKIKDERANELYSSLLNCNLDLESLTLKRTPYSQCIENSKEYKTNLEDLDLLIYEQVTGDSISEEDEYSIASSLFDFIKQMKHLKVLNIYGNKIISMYNEKIKNALKDMNLEEYYYKIKNEDGTEEKHKKQVKFSFKEKKTSY